MTDPFKINPDLKFILQNQSLLDALANVNIAAIAESVSSTNEENNNSRSDSSDDK